jgi:hypothetical protein
MATRGIIGVDCGQGTWRGRYVHWDNYPDRIVPLLAELVERDGLDKVIQTIIHKRKSWSILDTQVDESSSFFTAQNYEPGYGFFHTDDGMDEYTESSGFYSWAEYVYVIDDEGVKVFSVTGLEPETLDFERRYTWEEARAISQPA